MPGNLSLRLCLRLVGVGLLLVLLALAQGLRQELLELGVLELLLRLDNFRVEPRGRVGDERRATGQERDREVERGNKSVRRGEAICNHGVSKSRTPAWSWKLQLT